MTLLQPREMIPSFALTSTDGHEIRSFSFRGRKSLVLFFATPGSLGLVDALASRADEIREEDAELLVFSAERSQPVSSNKGVCVLVDHKGDVLSRYVRQGEAALYITDQYGEIYAAYPNERFPNMPDVDEVIASLRHISAACPE